LLPLLALRQTIPPLLLAISPALVAVYATKFLDKVLLRKMLHQWADEWENDTNKDF
jgi:hypothetical protein